MKYFGTEAYSEPSQTYKIELISKILILDAWSGSECASLVVTVNLVLKKKKKKKQTTDWIVTVNSNFIWLLLLVLNKNSIIIFSFEFFNHFLTRNLISYVNSHDNFFGQYCESETFFSIFFFFFHTFWFIGTNWGW